jgi:hypothetical protein
VAGLHTPEEVQDFDAAPATVVDFIPKPKTAEKPRVTIDTTCVDVPPVAAPADGPKASKEQVTALCTVMTKAGIKDRPAVIAWINKQIAPRSVESRLDLTSAEASKCIDEAETLVNEANKE